MTNKYNLDGEYPWGYLATLTDVATNGGKEEFPRDYKQVKTEEEQIELLEDIIRRGK